MAEHAATGDEVTEALRARVEELEFENGVLRLQVDVLSSTDIVTGLPNVNGMIGVLELAVARSRRSGEPFGVMVVEIPALATIANRHGADAHHDALRHTGAMIAAGLRQLDSVGRLDDRSFLVVLPMLDDAGADTVVARIDELLGAMPMLFGDERIRFVPSIGLVLAHGPDIEATAALDAAFAARDRAVPGAPAVVEIPAPDRARD